MKGLEPPKLPAIAKPTKPGKSELRVPNVAGMNAADETKRISDKLLTRLNAKDRVRSIR